ncbi:LysR family transcriptional regulator [Rhodococcus erythropolis]|uniref:LysR family transcriptional regulator n=1 Tax=Rhodococcus erythropolis TaxID=1833 RepID=UPI0018A29FE1|nr:LysR family transcriptional regulator [Rhodococcus erythropolis]MBF7732027.1 LysR family transcriptional regulator [Rhodococcus erythropolis]MCZ4640681.1 LysR family transcriptional regulator [Rhodococcus erythropolis]
MAMDMDLNLLRVFDALVAEGSVTGAAERLNLSIPATSRALGRLRRAMDDPIFVRAGRGLVPTPFALRAAPQVRSLLEGAQGLLIDRKNFEPAELERTFVIRINEGTAASLTPALVRRFAAEAPNAVIRCVGEGNEDVDSLRNGSIDLDIGADPLPSSDVYSEILYREGHVGLVSKSSPLARTAQPTLAQLCEHPHVSTSRRGRTHGPIDDALSAVGMRRRVIAVVASPVAAALMAADSDLVALVPERLARYFAARLDVAWFAVPTELPAVTIHQQWHGRLDHDPAHKWLREQVREASV